MRLQPTPDAEGLGKTASSFGQEETDLNDIATWRNIYTAHYSRLCRFAALFLRDAARAEDVVEDVMFGLWLRRNDIAVIGSLEPYLMRAVRNRCLNELRLLSRKGEYSFSSLSPQENIDFLERVFSDGQHPLGCLLQREMESEIRQAVEALPSECRAVFSKSRYENKTYKEIAQDLDISVNTVKYHIKNALFLLHKRLAAYMKMLLF